MKDYDEGNVKSLEEDYYKNFFLRSPKKGKIYRGANWNNHNRESISSYEENSENNIIKERGEKEHKLGFSSQTNRFINNSNFEKNSYPGPGEYNEINKIDKLSKNPSYSKKGYGGLISTTNRFYNLKDRFDKYYPYSPNLYKYKRDLLNIHSKVPSPNLYKTMYYENGNKFKNKSNLNINIMNSGNNSPFRIFMNIKEPDCMSDYYFCPSNINKLSVFEFNNTGTARYFLNNFNKFKAVKKPDKTSNIFKYKNSNNDDCSENFFQENNFSNKGHIHNQDENEGNSDNSNIILEKKDKNKNFYLEKVRERSRKREKESEEIDFLKIIKNEAFLPYVSPFVSLKKSAKSIPISNSPRKEKSKINKTLKPDSYQINKHEKKFSFNWNF